MSAFLLPDVLAQLRREHPGVEIKLVATNSVRDLRRREADIAIRSGRPTDPNLVATRLRDTPAYLYATPGYLKRIGHPRTIADLSKADFIGFGDDDGRFMNGLNALGFSLTPKNFPIQTENHMVLWELVKSGLGIGAVIDQVGDTEPLVQRAVPMAPIAVPAWLVAHREVRTSRRVRMIFDLLREHLGPSKHGARSVARVAPPGLRAAKRGRKSHR